MEDVNFLGAFDPVDFWGEIEKHCYVKDGCIFFPAGSGCEIPLDKCKTPAKVLGWIEHLCNNPWVTRDIIRSFVIQVSNHNKILVRRNL